MAKVLVSYYSKSGNTEKMALAIAEAIRTAGGEAVVKRAEETKTVDLTEAGAVAIGSPDYFSYVAGQVKIIFDEALSAKSQISGKPGLCFVSHGGGGAAKEPFERLMQSLGFNLVSPCLLSKGEPVGDGLRKLEDAAKKLVAAIKK